MDGEPDAQAVELALVQEDRAGERQERDGGGTEAVARQRSRVPLLFWSGLCFAALTLNNVLVVLDRMVWTELDLSLLRHAAVVVVDTLEELMDLDREGI